MRTGCLGVGDAVQDLEPLGEEVELELLPLPASLERCHALP